MAKRTCLALGALIAAGVLAPRAADAQDAIGCRAGKVSSLLPRKAEQGEGETREAEGTAADTAGAENAEAPGAPVNDSAESAEDVPELDVIDCTVTADDGTPAPLQIQFLSLNELSTSALFHGWASELEKLLGRSADIVETPAATEMRNILEQFSEHGGPFISGHISFVFHNEHFLAAVEEADADRVEMGHQDVAPRDVVYNIARFGAPNAGLANLRYEISPSPADISGLDGTNWPGDVRLWYGLQTEMGHMSQRGHGIASLFKFREHGADRTTSAGGTFATILGPTQILLGRKRGILAETTSWRYMTRRELAGFHRAQQTFRTSMAGHRLVDAGRYDKLPRMRDMTGDDGSGELVVPKFVDAMQYFTRGHFPSDFAPVFQGIYDGSWESFFFPRRVNLDVAVIVNRSDRAVSLRQLGVKQSRDVYLRRVESEGFPVGAQLARPDDAEWSLPPGGRVTVPLRILLAYEPVVTDYFRKEAEARAIHQAVAAYPPDTMLEYTEISHWLDLLWNEPLMRRAAGSFTPPAAPDMAPYVHDVSSRLEYLETRNGRVWLPGAEIPTVSLSFTAHSEGAQCPYLYAWDDAKGAFERLGKVLVSSDFDYDAREQSVKLPRPALRFRIAEEENEVSFIDAATLRAQLSDGREFTLVPDITELEAEDAKPVVLSAGNHVDFVFELPEDVSSDEIQSATLDIKGHYVRYGRLLLAARTR